MNSAAGVGIRAYNGNAPYGISNMFDHKNVNRSNSLHERKFNPATDYVRNQQRLEPLVQRHQKISRISVKNDNYVSTDAKQLEQIQEDQRRFNSR